MNRKYIFAAMVILILAGISTALLRYVVREPGVHFSETEAFQEEAFDLRLDSGLFGGLGSFPITLTASATGKSEVYWK